MSDHGHLRVARPVVDDLPGGRQWNANAVQALDEDRVVLHDLQDIDAHSSHNFHGADDVRRVGELNADLGDGTSDWAHAVGDHVHGASLHAALESARHLVVEIRGRHPVAERRDLQSAEVQRWIGLFETVRRRRDRFELVRRADECSRLYSSYVRWIRQRQPTFKKKCIINVTFYD